MKKPGTDRKPQTLVADMKRCYNETGTVMPDTSKTRHQAEVTVAQNDHQIEEDPPSIGQGSEDEYPMFEIVTAEKIDRQLRTLSNETVHEVASFAPGGALTAEQIKHTQSRNKEMYARGIRSRTIYLTSVRNDKSTLDHVRWLNERGSEVRTVPALPLRMIISDKKTAVVPLRLADGMLGAVIHRSEGVVAGLQALFEMTWSTASPLGLTVATATDPITITERALLEQLALGRTDKEVIKVMGLSERTVARMVAALMARLNAATRFEAAYNAVKRNWI